MSQRFQVSDRVAYRRIDTDYALVIENRNEPEILLLEGQASALFDRLAAGWTLGELIDDAKRAYQVRVTADISGEIRQFVSELQTYGILSPCEKRDAADNSAHLGADAVCWPEQWATPAIGVREPVTVLAGFCTLATSACRGYGQRPVRSNM